MTDLKKVYISPSEESALFELDTFDEKCSSKYLKIAVYLRNNLASLATYFKYPQEVRTLIFTTNLIEGFNRQIRTVTKSKAVFPTDDSLIKILHLAIIDDQEMGPRSKVLWQNPLPA